MSVLITGATGYIGSQFVKELKERGIVCHVLKRGQYSNFKTFRQISLCLKPLLVINCAAYTATGGVDNCENDKEQTLQANLLLPQMLVHACDLINTPLMHISTGCLYQGDNQGYGWEEDAPPHLTIDSGAGIYVSSKQMAEDVVKQYDKAYICRVRLPFDEHDHPRNLLTKLQNFDTVVDEAQSLCHRGDLVKACLDLWRIRAPFGIYNCTNQGSANYRDVCLEINRRIWHGRKGFKFISPETFDKTARTIKSRCTLSVKKLLDTGVTMRHVSEAVDESLEKWTTQ